MAKRFIDTGIWDRKWFYGLSNSHKLFWMYLITKCDHAGVWNVNMDLARFQLGGVEISEDEILDIFSNKIMVIESGEKWFIPSFIMFQYGELNPSVRAHKSVIDILNAERVTKGFINRLQTVKDKDKDMDKDKDKDKAKVKDKELYSEDKGNEKKLELIELKKRNKEQFEMIWKSYPRDSGKKPGLEKYLVLAPDEDLFNLIYSDIVERSKSYDWRKSDGKYVPLMTTYLNQERWNDAMLPVNAPAEERDSGGRKPYIEDEEDD